MKPRLHPWAAAHLDCSISASLGQQKPCAALPLGTSPPTLTVSRAEAERYVSLQHRIFHALDTHHHRYAFQGDTEGEAREMLMPRGARGLSTLDFMTLPNTVDHMTDALKGDDTLSSDTALPSTTASKVKSSGGKESEALFSPLPELQPSLRKKQRRRPRLSSPSPGLITLMERYLLGQLSLWSRRSKQRRLLASLRRKGVSGDDAKRSRDAFAAVQRDAWHLVWLMQLPYTILSNAVLRAVEDAQISGRDDVPTTPPDRDAAATATATPSASPPTNSRFILSADDAFVSTDMLRSATWSRGAAVHQIVSLCQSDTFQRRLRRCLWAELQESHQQILDAAKAALYEARQEHGSRPQPPYATAASPPSSPLLTSEEQGLSSRSDSTVALPYTRDGAGQLVEVPVQALLEDLFCLPAEIASLQTSSSSPPSHQLRVQSIEQSSHFLFYSSSDAVSKVFSCRPPTNIFCSATAPSSSALERSRGQDSSRGTAPPRLSPLHQLWILLSEVSRLRIALAYLVQLEEVLSPLRSVQLGREDSITSTAATSSISSSSARSENIRGLEQEEAELDLVLPLFRLLSSRVDFLMRPAVHQTRFLSKQQVVWRRASALPGVGDNRGSTTAAGGGEADRRCSSVQEFYRNYTALTTALRGGSGDAMEHRVTRAAVQDAASSDAPSPPGRLVEAELPEEEAAFLRELTEVQRPVAVVEPKALVRSGGVPRDHSARADVSSAARLPCKDESSSQRGSDAGSSRTDLKGADGATASSSSAEVVLICRRPSVDDPWPFGVLQSRSVSSLLKLRLPSTPADTTAPCDSNGGRQLARLTRANNDADTTAATATKGGVGRCSMRVRKCRRWGQQERWLTSSLQQHRLIESHPFIVKVNGAPVVDGEQVRSLLQKELELTIVLSNAKN